MLFILLLKLSQASYTQYYEDINKMVKECKSTCSRSKQNKIFKNLQHTSLVPLKLTSSSAVFLDKYKGKVIKRIVCDSKTRRCEEKLCLMFDHPNILKTHKVIAMQSGNVQERIYFMVSEYLELDIRMSTVNRNENTIKKICLDVLKGLKYMHDRGYAHLDLKIDNIMGTFKDGEFTYKLIDFGFTRKCDDGAIYLNNLYYGTFPYSPPEIYYDSTYTKKGDIWCVGMIAYYLATNKNLFYRRHGKRDYLKYEQFLNGNSPFSFEKTGVKLQNFIRRCMNVNYHLRPSVDEILEDKFLRE